LSEVPNLLTYIDPEASESFNMIKFTLFPSALADAPEPHKLIFRYYCESDERLGFYLIITMAVLRRTDNPLLMGGFDIHIEMRYIDENLRQNNSNNAVKYSSRIFAENGEHHCTKGYFSEEHDDVPRSEFTMDVRHILVSDASPDSVIDLKIVPM
jgi:hypothetical protein